MPETSELGSQQMPGFFRALWQGGVSGVRDIGRSAAVVSGDRSASEEDEQSPAAQPFGWSDAFSPFSRALPKIGFRLGQGSPTLAGSIAGSAALGGAGALTGPAAPVLAPVGAVAGGVGGAAAISAMQTLGPYFAKALRETPHDPEAAYQRAMRAAEIAGAFGGLGWALFPARFFTGPVKQALFQTFAVQPGVAVAQRATENAVEGQPITEGLEQTYVDAAVTNAALSSVNATKNAVAPGNPRPGGGAPPAPPPQAPPPPLGSPRPTELLSFEGSFPKRAEVAEEPPPQPPPSAGSDVLRSPPSEPAAETPRRPAGGTHEGVPRAAPEESDERNEQPKFQTQLGEGGEQTPEATTPESHEPQLKTPTDEQQTDEGKAGHALGKSEAEIPSSPPSGTKHLTFDDLVPGTTKSSNERLLRIRPEDQAEHSRPLDSALTAEPQSHSTPIESEGAVFNVIEPELDPTAAQRQPSQGSPPDVTPLPSSSRVSNDDASAVTSPTEQEPSSLAAPGA
jgi:hypothetical protein